MGEQAKEELDAVLSLLRLTCIKNGISAAFSHETKEIIFFDAKLYLEEGRFSGVKTTLDDLVK